MGETQGFATVVSATVIPEQHFNQVPGLRYGEPGPTSGSMLPNEPFLLVQFKKREAEDDDHGEDMEAIDMDYEQVGN